MLQITLPGIISCLQSAVCVHSACAFPHGFQHNFHLIFAFLRKKYICRISKQKQHFLKRGGTDSHRRSKITVICRFAVVQSCVGVFPLEMYPAFRLADLQSRRYAALVQIKKMATLANSEQALFFSFFFLHKE